LKRKSAGVLVSSPYLVWSVIFIVVPLAMIMYYAFTDDTGNFTFNNINEILKIEVLNSLLTSMLYAAIATAISLLLAYPLAYYMSTVSKSAQQTMVLLAMLPMWMNLLIRTYSLMLILENNGIINNILKFFGLPKVQLINTPGAVILGMIYNFLPYMILPIYSIMTKFDNSILEAASDLGANGFQKFRRIILPMSVPGIVSGITMVFVPCVSTFYISQKLGGAKTMLIGDMIERKFQGEMNYNVGAALSLILMVLILISMALMNRYSDDEQGVLIWKKAFHLKFTLCFYIYFCMHLFL